MPVVSAGRHFPAATSRFASGNAPAEHTRIPGARAAYDLAARLAVEHLQTCAKKSTVLDVGCADGGIFRFLPALHGEKTVDLIGCGYAEHTDAAFRAIPADKRSNVTMVPMDIRAWSFPRTDLLQSLPLSAGAVQVAFVNFALERVRSIDSKCLILKAIANAMPAGALIFVIERYELEAVGMEEMSCEAFPLSDDCPHRWTHQQARYGLLQAGFYDNWPLFLSYNFGGIVGVKAF